MSGIPESRGFWRRNDVARLDEAIDSVEGCHTLGELKSRLHTVVQDYGFASFGFVDVGSPGIDEPFWMATSDQRWNDDYLTHGLVHVDPVLPVVRRVNVPFTWSEVPIPPRSGKRRPGALKAMTAARDHGMTDGLVIPFHFVDRIGRLNSASCVLHWKDRKPLFKRLSRELRTELHIILIYWAQRVIDVAATEMKRRERFAPASAEAEPVNLTDRERSVMEWAARGKTMAETAAILSISGETVETYVRAAMRKLDAVNKTQAVVRAIKLGLIDA